MVLPLVKKAMANAKRRMDGWRERIKERPRTDKLMNQLTKAEDEYDALKELFKHLDALALKNK